MHDFGHVRGALGRDGAVFLGLFSSLLLLSVSCFSCSSGSSAPASPHDDAGGVGGADTGSPTTSDAGSGDAGSITLTGVMVDYETLNPVPGLTVTDNGVTATTNDAGTWTLTEPASVTTIAPMITGPNYSRLTFPFVTPPSSPSGVLDFGPQVIPDSPTFSLEQSVLNNTTTQALVQVVVALKPSCASAVGGTLTVTSPAGAAFKYFSTANVPDATKTSFQAVTPPRSVAVIYNIPVGSQVSVQVTVPNCTQVAFPTAFNGIMYPGTTTTTPTEPGDNNSALVVVLQ
ncbi:MAG: hypothetical protein ACLQVI_24085 [Polyangiaceae bacterium]|jgi:hypothetical protein